jgi:hypothetical protein
VCRNLACRRGRKKGEGEGGKGGEGREGREERGERREERGERREERGERREERGDKESNKERNSANVLIRHIFTLKTITREVVHMRQPLYNRFENLLVFHVEEQLSVPFFHLSLPLPPLAFLSLC